MFKLKLFKDAFDIIYFGYSELFFRKPYQKLGFLFRGFAFIYRRTFIRKTKIIAIVGSLGKTTTRKVLHTALNCPDRRFSRANYGTSLAQNVLRIKLGDTFAVIEAGISGTGWMKKYARFLKPQIVVVTSIASDHHRSFPTLEHTRKEKVQIVESLSSRDVVFLNGDDPNVLWMANQTVAKVITFGLNNGNDIRAEKVDSNQGGIRFEVILESQRYNIQSLLIGRHMVYPLLASLAVADYEGLNLNKVVQKISKVNSMENRMEEKQTPGNYYIIDDTHKGGLETYFSSLDAIGDYSAKRKFLFFGDIDDPPGNYSDCIRSIGKKASTVVNKIYCWSSLDRVRSLRAAAVAGGMDFRNIVVLGTDLDIAFEILSKELLPGDLLLIKGRQNYKIQRLVHMLMGHQVTCRVNYCDLKPSSCLSCPFVNGSNMIVDNYFVKKYFK